MKILSTTLMTVIMVSSNLFAQVGINSDNSNPDSSAMLDVKSISRGFMLPRMTAAERNAIANPAEGLIVYCTDCGSDGTISAYSKSVWRTYTLCSCPAPVAGTNGLSFGQITWSWNAVTGALGYRWNTVNDYTTALDMGTALTKSETGIACNTTYTRYVWAYNVCSFSAASTLSQTTPSGAPVTPSPGTHVVTPTQITWNWNSVPGALGYRWSQENNFSTATEMGLLTTKTEGSLICGTSYTRYVWAYNVCGYSTPVTLTKSTQYCFTCGDQISINHVVSGGVAPVDKTVVYGTVGNIPGATGKCWITRNFGASNQAASKDDNTEASAGWYWQFNRKQGYRHDGTTLTPSWTITSIIEASNWEPANDPCLLELGSGWHVPTNSQWSGVQTANSWTNWNGPWSSDLKMHAAGHLNYNTGALVNCGSYAYYWSGTYANTPTAFFLFFFSTDFLIVTETKAYGFTLRCIKE